MPVKRKKVSTSIRVAKSLPVACRFFSIPRETKIVLSVITASLAIFVIGSTAFAKENVFERLWRTIATSPIDTAHGEEAVDVCPSTPVLRCRHLRTDAESAFNNNQNANCQDTTQRYTGICNGTVVGLQGPFVIRECQKKSCVPQPSSGTGGSSGGTTDTTSGTTSGTDGSNNGTETSGGTTGSTTVQSVATNVELVSPSDTITLVGVDPALIWDTFSGAVAYDLHISSSTADLFDDPVKTLRITMSTPSEVCSYGTCSKRVRGLNATTAYHWRVLATASDGSIKYSPVRHFTTGNVPRNLFLQPKSGDNVGIGYSENPIDYKLAVSEDVYVGGSIYQNFPTGPGEVRGFFLSRNGGSYYTGNINLWPTGNLGIGTISVPQARLHVQRHAYAGVHGVLIDEDEPESNGNPKIELRGNGKHPYIDFTGTDLANDYDSRILYNSTAKTLNFSQIGGNGYSFDNKVYVKGDVNVQTALTKPADHLALATDRVGLDVAELFETEEPVEIGDVLVVGTKERKLKKSSRPYEEEIIGIVSGSPALLFEGSQVKLGAQPNRFTTGSKPPVALSGRVPVKVSLQNGPIKPGDYLTSSSKPGVAMRATEPGAIVGIALEAYDGHGEGKILAFVNVGEKNVAKEIKRLLREVQLLKARVR